mmetsp:Transcript_158835/g.509243  ORF Transcript_158835/g.509243 Transcript_158835/m.509243 type:complete len:223 (+) Transcript_158835:1489-2157(+)
MAAQARGPDSQGHPLGDPSAELLLHAGPQERPEVGEQPRRSVGALHRGDCPLAAAAQQLRLREGGGDGCGGAAGQHEAVRADGEGRHRRHLARPPGPLLVSRGERRHAGGGGGWRRRRRKLGGLDVRSLGGELRAADANEAEDGRQVVRLELQHLRLGLRAPDVHGDARGRRAHFRRADPSSAVVHHRGGEAEERASMLECGLRLCWIDRGLDSGDRLPCHN